MDAQPDRLLYGGPFDDHEGGLAIVEADDEDEALRIIDKDPAVIGGIFAAAPHPWVTVFDNPERASAFRSRCER